MWEEPAKAFRRLWWMAMAVFLVPLAVSGSFDGEMYMEAVRKLASNLELRTHFCCAGRQRAEELFSLEDANACISQIIQAAANIRK